MGTCWFVVRMLGEGGNRYLGRRVRMADVEDGTGGRGGDVSLMLVLSYQDRRIIP